MKDFLNQKRANKLARRILEELKDELVEIIGEGLFSQYSSHLDECYRSTKSHIEEELISSIVDEFIENPKDYKFSKLRTKLFRENKKTLTEVLTKDAIYNEVCKIIIGKIDKKKNDLAWQWRKGIGRFIRNNYNLFQNDKTIMADHVAEIKKIKDENKLLRKALDKKKKK